MSSRVARRGLAQPQLKFQLVTRLHRPLAIAAIEMDLDRSTQLLGELRKPADPRGGGAPYGTISELLLSPRAAVSPQAKVRGSTVLPLTNLS